MWRAGRRVRDRPDAEQRTPDMTENQSAHVASDWHLIREIMGDDLRDNDICFRPCEASTSQSKYLCHFRVWKTCFVTSLFISSLMHPEREGGQGRMSP